MMLVRHAMAVRPMTVSPDMQLRDARALEVGTPDRVKSRREAS